MKDTTTDDSSPVREPQQPDDPERSWLRPELPLEERVESLQAEMTLAEKVGQTHQIANIDPVLPVASVDDGGVAVGEDVLS